MTITIEEEVAILRRANATLRAANANLRGRLTEIRKLTKVGA